MTPVRLVLDASAVAEFTRGSVHVGEVLREVSDERAVAAVPLMCLVAATRTVDDPDLLDLLVAHQAVGVYAEEDSQWRELAATYAITGRLDAAAAALVALDMQAFILTAEPDLYSGIKNGQLTIRIGG